MNLRNICLLLALSPSVVWADDQANCQAQIVIVKRVDFNGKETVSQETKTVCTEGTKITPTAVYTNCGEKTWWKNGRLQSTPICQKGDGNWQIVLPN
jgi:hypothetical protein